MMDVNPILVSLILTGMVCGALLVVVMSTARTRMWVDRLVDANAKMRVILQTPAEFYKGSGTLSEGQVFQIIRHSHTHGNMWCRLVNSGEVFIIRTSTFAEALQENRIDRV
jgi:hypothetical protein